MISKILAVSAASVSANSFFGKSNPFDNPFFNHHGNSEESSHEHQDFEMPMERTHSYHQETNPFDKPFFKNHIDSEGNMIPMWGPGGPNNAFD